MRPISYTAICIGFILAAAAEGFCAGILLFLVVEAVCFHGETSIGSGLLLLVMVVFCSFMSALFQFPVLWNKVRPDLVTNPSPADS